MGDVPLDHEIRAMFAAADENGDGKINFPGKFSAGPLLWRSYREFRDWRSKEIDLKCIWTFYLSEFCVMFRNITGAVKWLARSHRWSMVLYRWPDVSMFVTLSESFHRAEQIATCIKCWNVTRLHGKHARKKKKLLASLYPAFSRWLPFSWSLMHKQSMTDSHDCHAD